MAGKVTYFDQATIKLDGATRQATDANGKPLHYAKYWIANFWRWFDGVGRKQVNVENKGGQDDSRRNSSRFFLDSLGQPWNYHHGIRNDLKEFKLDHPNQ